MDLIVYLFWLVFGGGVSRLGHAEFAVRVAATTVNASFNIGTRDLTITVNGVSTVVNIP